MKYKIRHTHTVTHIDTQQHDNTVKNTSAETQEAATRSNETRHHQLKHCTHNQTWVKQQTAPESDWWRLLLGLFNTMGCKV